MASLIGHQGAIACLKKQYAQKPELLTSYLNEEYDYKLFVEHFIRGANQLDTLYNSFNEELSIEEKTGIKKEAISSIIKNLDTLQLKSNGRRLNEMFVELPNNAYLMSFIRYSSKQGNFEEEFVSNFKDDLRAYIRYYKNNYPSL